VHQLQDREACLSEKPARVRYLKTADVARLCGVTTATVRKWVEVGGLKSFRLPGGCQMRFHREDVLEFMRHSGFLKAWETLPEEKYA